MKRSSRVLYHGNTKIFFLEKYILTKEIRPIYFSARRSDGVDTLQHFWPWPEALLTIKAVTSVEDEDSKKEDDKNCSICIKL